jgi:hypothetical protein
MLCTMQPCINFAHKAQPEADGDLGGFACAAAERT